MGAPPADLPGQEITDKQFFLYQNPGDSIERQTPSDAPESPTWFDRVAKTWEAPALPVQLAEDEKKMLMGMGAVFVPCLGDAELEPEIEILDRNGKVAAGGATGTKYSLMPGDYHVMIGSGSHSRRIVKKATVSEGNVTTVLPTWCGLSIDIVDHGNQPFRGEYEIARIDKFEALGRGFGRDPDLGERIKTWILKPGTYKIFGVGQGYNTLTNFVTVRLLPGEFVRFLLVQDEEDFTIKGGGTVALDIGRSLTSNWKYGLDLGGAVDFRKVKDIRDPTENINDLSISLLFHTKLLYKKAISEWESRLRVSEGVAVSNWDLTRLRSTPDEVILSSIFTWRFLQWLGPYGRMETSTGLFPEFERPAKGTNRAFILFDENKHFDSIDSTTRSWQMESPFSPFAFEAGVGANVRALHTRYVEARVLAGLGFRTKSSRNESAILDSADVRGQVDTTEYTTWSPCFLDSTRVKTVILRYPDMHLREFGAEVVFSNSFRLGRIANIESELKYFAPFERISRPDWKWRTTLSWRLARAVMLDNEFLFTLEQPEEETLREKNWQISVLIRFSYTSR